MKTIYIDITNIPELKRYTGISRVVSEIAANMINDRVDIRLLAYFPKAGAYRLVDNDRFLLALNGMLADKRECYTDTYIPVDELEEGAVFFDANSTWHTLPNRSWLLPKLKARQIRVIPLIHDIIPIRYPQHMVGQTLMRFMEFLTAHLTYADDIVVTTEAVKEDIRQLCRELEIPEKPIHKIGLGADFSTDKSRNDADEAVDPAVEAMVEDRRFLLTVGTVEPRKNQKVLVEAYEKKLADMDIDVVIVGHIGWEMEGFINRIKTNRKYNRGLYLLSDANDATLNFLYKRAFMVVFASYIEGYGLPTIEALINGVPIVCSDIPVMREVGGRFCDYFDPDSSDELIKVISRYAGDMDAYNERKRLITEEYAPPKWRDTAAKMEALMLGHDDRGHFEHKPVKQIVFLSARPDPILATLPYIEEFMPFIKELVVCCPDYMADYMHQFYKGGLKLTTITDDQLLAGRTLPPDHSTRNFFLRCLAMEQEAIDDEFIMCDDDYRPLHPITEEFFYKDGKYRGYYFADISQWKYYITELFSYDYCHFRTLRFLRSHGYPTFQYSAHMPQLINKVWYRELIAKYPEIRTMGYDEWSTYFNYIAAEHREQYQPCKYTTLCWPDIGGPPRGVTQPEFAFENFYSENYARGRAFAGLSESFRGRDKVLEENQTKKLIAAKYKVSFEEAVRRSESYEAEYEQKYNEFPSIAVHIPAGKDPVPYLGMPCEYRASRVFQNRIQVGISRAERGIANILTVIVQMSLIDSDGNILYSRASKVSPRMDYTHFQFYIPKTLPDDKGLSIYVRAWVHTKSTFTEKKCPIVFTD